MAWWIWAAAGLLLLGLEFLTPGGFFVFFFGVGAFAASACAAAGLMNLPAQLGVFGVISAVSLVVLRKRLVEKFQAGPDLQRSLGDVAGGVAVASEDIPAGGLGRAEYRGTPWTARNESPGPIKKGQRCRIESVEGLTIRVKPE